VGSNYQAPSDVLSITDHDLEVSISLVSSFENVCIAGRRHRLRKQSILNLGEFHGHGTFFVVVSHVVDPPAYGIAAHQPGIAGLEQTMADRGQRFPFGFQSGWRSDRAKRKRPRLTESWSASLEQPSPEVCSIPT
jgi:hypothetical protein